MIITQKEEIVKDDILKEAQKLFQQFGLKKTTMEDIARSMGKGKTPYIITIAVRNRYLMPSLVKK